MKFKVWVEIEAVDDDLGIYEDASPFPVCLGEFDSLEEADELIQEISDGKSSRTGLNANVGVRMLNK